MSEPAFYAKGNTVFKSPVHTKIDGGERITIGFPVCEVTDYVDADAVAKVLVAGEQHEGLVKALEEIDKMPVSMVNDSESLRHSIKTIQRIASAALRSVSRQEQR